MAGGCQRLIGQAGDVGVDRVHVVARQQLFEQRLVLGKRLVVQLRARVRTERRIMIRSTTLSTVVNGR